MTRTIVLVCKFPARLSFTILYLYYLLDKREKTVEFLQLDAKRHFSDFLPTVLAARNTQHISLVWLWHHLILQKKYSLETLFSLAWHWTNACKRYEKKEMGFIGIICMLSIKRKYAYECILGFSCIGETWLDDICRFQFCDVQVRIIQSTIIRRDKEKK